MHEMMTTLETITNDMDEKKSNIIVTASGTDKTVEKPGNGVGVVRIEDLVESDNANSLAYPEVPALLIVKPVQCRAIPGHFILSCYRREIEFTWIPPQLPIKKAMVKFKQVSSVFHLRHSGFDHCYCV